MTSSSSTARAQPTTGGGLSPFLEPGTCGKREAHGSRIGRLGIESQADNYTRVAFQGSPRVLDIEHMFGYGRREGSVVSHPLTTL